LISPAPVWKIASPSVISASVVMVWKSSAGPRLIESVLTTIPSSGAAQSP
jgi:hypothetical protein